MLNMTIALQTEQGGSKVSRTKIVRIYLLGINNVFVKFHSDPADSC